MRNVLKEDINVKRVVVLESTNDVLDLDEITSITINDVNSIDHAITVMENLFDSFINCLADTEEDTIREYKEEFKEFLNPEDEYTMNYTYNITGHNSFNESIGITVIIETDEIVVFD